MKLCYLPLGFLGAAAFGEPFGAHFAMNRPFVVNDTTSSIGCLVRGPLVGRDPGTQPYEDLE